MNYSRLKLVIVLKFKFFLLSFGSISKNSEFERLINVVEIGCFNL